MARFAPLGVAFIACTALAIAPLAKSNPKLIWNASPSVPIGLYLVEKRCPDVGEVAVLRPPEWASTLADQRAYLPKSALLLKPVAARKGDIVCRVGPFVFINGQIRAIALRRDRMKRPLPSWRGCLRLRGTQILVLARHKDSFDSRYFEPVDERNVIGVGKLIFPTAY